MLYILLITLQVQPPPSTSNNSQTTFSTPPSSPHSSPPSSSSSSPVPDLIDPADPPEPEDFEYNVYPRRCYCYPRRVNYLRLLAQLAVDASSITPDELRRRYAEVYSKLFLYVYLCSSFLIKLNRLYHNCQLLGLLVQKTTR